MQDIASAVELRLRDSGEVTDGGIVDCGIAFHQSDGTCSPRVEVAAVQFLKAVRYRVDGHGLER